MSGQELREKAAKLREHAQRIADGSGVPDRAAAMLSGKTHIQQLKRMDSALRRYTELIDQAKQLEGQAVRVEAAEREAARVRLTHTDLVGATHVLDQFGQWRKVVRLSAKSVTVETGYSWTDRLSFDKVRKVATIGAEVAS